MCCLQAQAQPPNGLAAPVWDGETVLSTDDGYAEFSWHMPPGEYAEIYRVTESRPGEQQTSFVSGTALRVYRIEPGWYDFRIQACHRNTEGVPGCGNSSPKLRLTVTESATPEPSGAAQPEPVAQAAVVGGPDQMRPGAWVNPDKDGQGWNFYWANRLALPDTDPLFGNSYDLVGLWYTFEAKDVFDDQEVCKCLIPITYRPVVAELKLVKLDATTYSGGIWITRNGQAAQIGSANVIFGANNTTATINWSGTFKNETISAVSDPVSLLLGNDPASTSNITHYSGNWRLATQNGYFVDDLIGNIAEVVTVTFDDSLGDPLWVQELNTSLVSTNVNLCLGYLDSGYPPDATQPSGWADSQPWVYSGCDGSQAGSGTNRNARRYFSNFDTERFWASFSLSGASYASGSVSIGTASSPVYLNKTANLHGIFFSGDNGCEISSTTPSCTVDLTWFTDSDYPSASAFAYNFSTGAHSLIKTSTEPAEVGYTYTLSAAGTYRFELRMGDTTSSTLIANSQDFTVTEVSGAPVTPTDLGVVWTDEPNREYRVQWQHPDQASVDSYTVRETLPDASIMTYTVTPGTNLSRLFSRSSGPFGEYAYQVRACQGSNCSDYTAAVPWVINEEPSGEHPWGDNAYGSLVTNLSYHYAMGYHFTPTVNGQITELGGFFNGSKVVKLFLRNEPELNLLRSTVVTSSNSWSYASITPINIVAGTEYTVAVYLAGSGGSYRSGTSFPDTFGSIEILGSTYASTSSNPDAVPTNSTFTTMYGQVDIGFVPDPVTPEPPVITPIADQQNEEGDSVSLQVDASDPDGTVVSITDNASLPSGLSINNAGLISGTIAAGAAGGSPWTVTITATDDDDLTDQDTFTWTVTAPNQNPSIGNPGAQNSNPDDVINLPIPVSDPDGDQLSCSASGLPPSLGVAIDAANANCVVSGTITVTSDASYSVTITVNDSNGGIANSSFPWEVTTINQSPTIGNPGTQNSSPDDAISLAIPVSDPDGDQMSCSDAGLPASLGVAIDAANANCVVSGIITAADGTYPVTITVNDADDGTAATNFDWVVKTSNSDPSIENPGTQNSQPNDVVNLLIPVSDPDGDLMSCSASGLPASLGVAIDAANANCVVSGTITAADGNYPVTITVNDGNGGTADSVFTWIVFTPGPSNPESPPMPAGAPDMTPTIASSEVGATAGQFRVDESGSATYSIPFLTAPGSGGVAPEISLNYSSQSGNGPLGMGWSLGGISAITRCARTIEQDGATGSVNLDSNDRFCLDGQRLLLVSGTYGANGAEYRTETDDISRIKSVGAFGSGPASFTVERKDGSISEYGNTVDSQIEAGSEVLTWAQNRFEDSAGNYIIYHYDEVSDPIEFVIDQIEYTGNANASTSPYARLNFIWAEGRADTTNVFIGGAELQQTKYLARIDSQAKKDAASAYSNLRSYFLAYTNDGMGRRSLRSVEECNSSSKQACFAAADFSWLNSLHGIGTAISHDNVLAKNQVLHGLQIADVSGDGRPDILYTKKTGPNYKLEIQSPNANGAFSRWGGSYALPKKEDGTPPRVFGIDLNADGFQDVIFRKHLSNGNYQWAGRLSSGSGLGEELILSTSTFMVNETDSTIESRVSVLDFNGDGLSDVLYNKTSALGDTHEIEVAINTWSPGGTVGLAAPIEISSNFETMFPSPVKDANGDVWETFDKPNFTDWNSTQLQGRNTPEGRVFDYNGDGAADLLINVWREYRNCVDNCLDPQSASGPGEATSQSTPVYQFELVSFWLLMTSTGSNTYSEQVIGIGAACGLPNPCDVYPDVPATDLMWPVDVNADGLAEIAYTSSGSPDAGKAWHYRLNTGNGFETTTRSITAIPSPIPVLAEDLVRFEDLNGDGYPDLIYPSAVQAQTATWRVIYNQFGLAFGNPVTTSIKAGNLGGESNDENDANIFADFTGDGKTDHLYFNFDTKAKPVDSDLYPGWNQLNASSIIAPSNVITAITNGLEAVTSVSYKPLTDTSVYSRMRDSGNADWGAGSVVYDLVAPIFVVSDASRSAPTFSSASAISRVEYHYVGAKIQAGGRGFLGFGEVISYDPQNGIRTNTRYRQDFPFTGLPADTTQALARSSQKFNIISNTGATSPVVWGSVSASTSAAALPSGTRLSYAIKEWAKLTTEGGAVFPFIANSLERSYTLTGAFDRKVLTSNVYGSHGNLTDSTVRTYATDASTAFATQSTSNTYNDNISNWHLGRLATSSVTHSRAGKPSITRQSSFSYDTATGIMVEEVIEPNANAFKVTTNYLLDAFGNRKQTTVTGFGMTPRDSFATFDALGRFVLETRNDFGQVTQKVNDWDAYGNALATENIDGVLTLTAADHMGRPFASYTEMGAWSKTLNFTPGSVCPSGSVYRASTTSGGKPTQHQCLDALGRTIRTATDGFDGTRIYVDQYFDSSGRPERVSEPYYAGTTRYWNLTDYDAIGRPTTLTAADGDDQIIEYDADPDIACTTSNVRVKQTTNGLGQIHVEVMNALGETTDVYDDNCGWVSYDYDAIGNLTRVTGADGEAVTMSYDLAGRKIAMSDPDKGNWQYAYNPLGEMTRQRDGKSQAIDFSYDTLGRVTNRRELSGVSGLTDTSFTTHNHEITTYQNSTSLSVMGKGQPTSIVYRQGEAGTILHQRDYNYDSFGRVDVVSTTVGSDQFAEQTTYDQFGRVFQQFDASGDDRGLRYVYTASGYLSQLKEAREGTAGAVYQQVEAMGARGNVTYMVLGNGVEAFATYAPASGRLTELAAYDALGTQLQEVDYVFDVLGNLRQRHDQSAGADLREQFDYDDLNRLLSIDLSVNGGAASQTLALNYDAAGNITFKSDVGAYLYNAAQPHAVSSAGGVSYSYDANGNQTAGGGRDIDYTVFDKAEVITKGVKQAVFSYGVGNTRYQREDKEGGITQKTTTYLGSVERVDDGSSIHFKRYLGGVAVATYYPSTQAQNLAYLLKDHIGSIHTVLNESAQIMARMHFGAFGERQDTTNWQTPLTAGLYAPLNDITTRGFTGHEQVDDVGIIHMNGRIYDARLGRFLQADPIVQAPKNSQNLNRYSYVLNNPLSYTDPSGFFLKRLFKKWGRVIIAAVASYYTFGWTSNLAWGAMPSVAAGVSTTGAYVGSAAIGGAVAGFVGGAIISGSMRGAVKGAFSGAVAGGIFGYFGNTYSISRILSDTLAGGIAAELNGQQFKDGLLFAALVSSATYITVRLRAYQARKSAQFPGQIGESAGFRGIPGKLAGERFNEKIWIESGAAELYAQGKPWKEVVERYLNKKLADGWLSPLGGLQGGKRQIFGREYKIGGFADYVLEGYAGVHDSLNQPFFYNLNGTNRQISGALWRGLGKAVNASNVIIASPIVLPSLIPDYMRHLYFSDEHL